MTVRFCGKLAGALALTVALAGCIDAKIEVDVTSDTTAKATITQTMSAEIYPMIKASQAESKASDDAEAAAADDFCSDGTLTENADGGATCTITKEGAFADLVFDEEGEEQGMTFTSAGPGLVRVAFPTNEITKDLGQEEEMDAQTKAMMQQMFEGHAFTLKIGGGEVTDTNMTLAADKQSAETVIPFLDIINGTVELPEELYAVVRK
ncbi:hypothetical protein GCM10011321_34060 [Youhaiella tibetensis]|uniref:Uncharacterized protein n=1 Tax=Paradevosia tibetensis TaxID=1447062 RepID=A0A5B9DTX0_9HYPH|nr:hypothetical protein [Youhaiella tibetensis]AKR57705.1 hypothetical protein XM25_18335 [Devosia sp. H5989]QEE22626.1 hypothetical protein FNA67_21745 [Youhaiella tibetensis]GGF40403.1 hypothetical protein GCM10011321_34060 [Youhaiella tibetensis]